jgi:hypothetical protein
VVPAVDPRVLRALQDSITAAFLVWVLVVVLREVFRPGTTGRNAIMGALGGFLVILTIFTRVHGLIETVSPGAYRLSGEAASAPAAAAEAGDLPVLQHGHDDDRRLRRHRARRDRGASRDRGSKRSWGRSTLRW